MKIIKFVFNPIQENTYVIWDETGECAIVDAGNASAREDAALADFIAAPGAETGCRRKYARAFRPYDGRTICERDFRRPVRRIVRRRIPYRTRSRKRSDVRSAGGGDADYRYRFVEDRRNRIRQYEIQSDKDPGTYSRRSGAFRTGTKSLFTGDTLFRESIGRTDLPGGDYGALMHSIIENIIPLGDEVAIYPGHGEKSTIGHESLYNPFVVEALNGEVRYK